MGRHQPTARSRVEGVDRGGLVPGSGKDCRSASHAEWGERSGICLCTACSLRCSPAALVCVSLPHRRRSLHGLSSFDVCALMLCCSSGVLAVCDVRVAWGVGVCVLLRGVRFAQSPFLAMAPSPGWV